jgi:hypothetical protein
MMDVARPPRNPSEERGVRCRLRAASERRLCRRNPPGPPEARDGPRACVPGPRPRGEMDDSEGADAPPR